MQPPIRESCPIVLLPKGILGLYIAHAELENLKKKLLVKILSLTNKADLETWSVT